MSTVADVFPFLILIPSLPSLTLLHSLPIFHTLSLCICRELPRFENLDPKVHGEVHLNKSDTGARSGIESSEMKI